MKTLFAIRNIGTTTVTAPADATAAIEAAKNPAQNGVAGQTFVFDELIFEYDSSVTSDMKEQLESQKPMMAAMYADSKIIFGNNGDFTMLMVVMEQDMTVVGTYTESAGVVILTPVTVGGQPSSESDEPQAFTLLDNKLSASADIQDGITMVMVYRLQTA